MRWRYLPSKRRQQRAALLNELKADNLCRAAIERDGRQEAEWDFGRERVSRVYGLMWKRERPHPRHPVNP